MQLIADRFLAHDRSSSSFAQDLATGQPVWLQMQPAGDAADRRRWLLRCDELFRLRHPALATLVDYGFNGPLHLFEAWACVRSWTGDRTTAKETVVQACRFLRAIALSATEDGQLVFNGPGHDRTVAVPSIDCGYPLSPGHALGAEDLVAPGIALVSRPSVGAFCEMLRSFEEQRPRAAAIWGPPGAGLATAVLTLARDARANGFVPIDAQATGLVHGGAMAGRTLFIIDRRAGGALSAVLRATLRSPRAHVCLVIAREEPTGVDGIEIGKIDAGALIGAVRPSVPNSPFIRQAADRAGGLPGVFASALWRRWVNHGRPRRMLSRVAESTATYESEPAEAECAIDVESERPMVVAPQAAVEDRSALTRKVDQAERLLAAGRHAPGLRLLRHAIAALARRKASAEAARAGLVLATELMTRGRTADALRTSNEVQEQAAKGGDAALLREVAIVAGNAWIDATRLDEAERTLRAALMTAQTVADRERELRIRATLARCLFWRADFDAAAALLEGECADLTVETKTRCLLLRGRITAARGDSAAALTAIGEMARLVESTGQRALEADLHSGSALVRLLIGDLDSVDAEVERCLSAARGARRPMRMVSALLVQAEARRRQRRPLVVERRRLLERLVQTATPLLKLRFALIETLCGARDQTAALAQFTDSTPVKALGVMSGERGSGPAAGVDPLVRELLGILNVCQDAEDERVVLGQVCVRVRKQLRAAAVTFVVPSNGRWDTLAADGPRFESDIGERACAAGVTIGPYRRGERLESAAPVQYGGTAIAALCARWTPGADELARAASVLSMAAAAAAPIVSAALAHRAVQVRPIGFDLIGAAPAVAELRRAVEHAAAAPFPVLIEGESGSGKELVARGIHRCSPRRARTFCTLNCAALPEELVESELFGHARGSFTGAMGDRAGVFEEAHGGTLFLDEVGELSPRAQAKLLRVIQEGELRRIGENVSRRIDVRIVAATNRDLRSEADAGRFRRDLLYRLDVIRITVPPLRDRREDLPALVDHFWTDATQRVGSRATLSTAARAALGTYDWPGNVRELQNVLASIAVRCPKRGVVPPTALPPHVVAARRPDVWRLEAARRTFEEGFVRAALVRAGGHRSRAADELGLTRQGLNKLMVRLGIE